MESPQINSGSDYRRALARANILIDATPGTAEYEELRALALVIEAWERGHFPIAPVSPSAALKFRADQLGYTVTRGVVRARGMLKFAPAKKAAARPPGKRAPRVAFKKVARTSGRRVLRCTARKRK